jgi:hypothetical protein
MQRKSQFARVQEPWFNKKSSTVILAVQYQQGISIVTCAVRQRGRNESMRRITISQQGTIWRGKSRGGCLHGEIEMHSGSGQASHAQADKTTEYRFVDQRFGNEAVTDQQYCYTQNRRSDEDHSMDQVSQTLMTVRERKVERLHSRRGGPTLAITSSMVPSLVASAESCRQSCPRWRGRDPRA